MENNKLANNIIQEIKKTARYHSGQDNGHFEKDYDNVELVINGEKVKCYVDVDADFEFDWFYEDDTYWEPGQRKIEKLDFWINKIGVSDIDGTIYTEEQEDKILEENRKTIEELIEDDIKTQAYEMDWI